MGIAAVPNKRPCGCKPGGPWSACDGSDPLGDGHDVNLAPLRQLGVLRRGMMPFAPDCSGWIPDLRRGDSRRTGHEPVWYAQNLGLRDHRKSELLIEPDVLGLVSLQVGLAVPCWSTFVHA